MTTGASSTIDWLVVERVATSRPAAISTTDPATASTQPDGCRTRKKALLADRQPYIISSPVWFFCNCSPASPSSVIA